jgi:FixJ family two-component response regulator
MEKISILIATSRGEDAGNLRAHLADSPWELVEIQDATAALKSASVPILLLDSNLLETGGESTWQVELKKLAKTRRSASVILLSNVTDQYLWDEVVQHGGFDVLTRPFKKETILSVLLFAYAHCRTPWPKAVS